MINFSEVVRAILVDRPKANRVIRLHRELGAAWNSPRRWAIIREYYNLRQDDILRGARHDPYELGLERFFTPIEEQLWIEIRGVGLPFWPQYPVGRRFVDFGDPVRCIAIEADGAAYHNVDGDARKDADLRAAGWRVFRVKGRDCFREGALRDLYSQYGRHDDGQRHESRTEEAE